MESDSKDMINTHSIPDDNIINTKLQQIQQYKRRENLYCNNCGKHGHAHKRCYEPIMSFGVICLNLYRSPCNKKILDFFMTKYKFPRDVQQLKNISINKYIQKNISCNNRKDIDIYHAKILDEMECIMVRRKLSFNYIHIIRGLYNFELEDIIKSINLITHNEYNNLLTKNFDELWKDIWGEYKIDSPNDYSKAKEQFMFLKEYVLPQIAHKVNIVFNEPEWGFPKGRRIDNETNIDCARREFNEETGLTNNDYVILDRLFPLIENIKGTNGLNYKHVYYIALLEDNFNIKNVYLGKGESQKFEIGDIGLYKMDKAKNILREFNVERKEIICDIQYFFIYNIRYFEKFYHDKPIRI